MGAAPVVIIGAGLAGMAAARRLDQEGIPHVVLEAASHPGGLVITRQEQGFRFDLTGHLLHLRDDRMRRLVRPWLGEDVRLVQRRSMVWSHGRYTRYPYQANTYGLPPKVAYECLMGFLEARDRGVKRQPRNFEEFSLAYFGEGFSKHFMIPYNAKLWGVHPREITMDWCQRFVPIPKLEDVIAGAVGLNDRELGYNTEFVYPAEGIGVLSESMAREVKGIRYESPVRFVDLDLSVVELEDGSAIGFSALVSTMPLDRLVQSLRHPPEPIVDHGAKLRCNPLYYLDVALDVPNGVPYHWVYVPEERYPFYRVGCYSHFSEKMAPKGKACLYVELADRRRPDLDRLLPTVADGLVEMGIIEHADDIAFARLRKIEHAYVIYDHAHQRATQELKDYFERHHVLSVGRYGGWNYSSMEDALLFGEQAALRVKDWLS